MKDNKLGVCPNLPENCNPGNIRFSKSNQWYGQIDEDINGFVRFVEPAFGIRAMCHLIHNYMNLYGDNTIRKIITRYAPPEENPTYNYIEYVAHKLGRSSCATIRPGGGWLLLLCRAMSEFELGDKIYTNEQWKAGYLLYQHM